MDYVSYKVFLINHTACSNFCFSGDVFFVGDGDEESGIGFDLAVLAHSNHTIMSRGTFSMWGAILCGGEQYSEYGTIVPTSLQE